MRPNLSADDVARVLAAAENAAPVEAVAAVTRTLRTAFGASSVSFLILDSSGSALVRLAHVPLDLEGRGDGGHPPVTGERRAKEESATLLPFDGGPAEQALRTQTLRVLDPAIGSAEAGTPRHWTVLAPVTERGESIGLLELSLPSRPEARTLEEVSRMAHLLAFVVIANGRHTDLFEWGQRTRAFSLSAEIQQRLLPGARTCEAGAFTLAGWLEPAESIGGDTFDYSLDRDTLHLSLTDAMGHGVASALTASVCLGSLRGSRRTGATMLEQAAFANDAVAEHAATTRTDDFATGLMGRLNLRTGSLELLSAGHKSPLLARGGQVTELGLPADLPFGMFPGYAYRSSELTLEPGDRVVFVTDGMIERQAATVDLPQAILDGVRLHPREAVRALAGKALEAAGHALSDDATVLCLDWHGDHARDRDTEAGADPSRASESST